MTLKFTRVRVLVADYAKAFAFYGEKLGLAARFSDPKSGYGEFDAGAVILALFDRANMAAAVGDVIKAPGENAGGGGPILIFNVDDVDVASRELEGKGVVLLVPPTNRPEWTIRTAHLKDPDGNLIEINGPLKRTSVT